MSALLAAGLVACGGQRDEPGSLRNMVVGPEPRLVIGALEGDSAYLFERIRTARFAADGRIVVADRGLGVIRVFDAAGRFQDQMGGAGEGPGEFVELRDMWMVSPDTVGVWDSRAMRLTYFTVDGDLAGTVHVRPDSRLHGNLDFLAGTFSDGSVVIAAVALGTAPEAGAVADEIHLAHFDRSGALLDTGPVVGGLLRETMGRVRGPGPFSPYPFTAVLRDSLVFTNGAEPSVEVRDLTWHGRVVAFPPRAVGADSAWKALKSGLEARDDWQLQLLADVPRTDSLPHVAGLLVDDRGRLWTKQFDPGADALWLRGGSDVGGGTWWVADADGSAVSAATLPLRLRPVEVRGGELLGVATDSLGVERVAVFPIKPD